MAPPYGMLSHLRFHRNSSSTALDPSSPSSQHSQQSPFTPTGASPLEGSASPGDVSSLPPVLPPITRVTTTTIDLETNEGQDAKSSPSDARPPQAPRSPYNAVSGFIGGVALRRHRREASVQRSPIAESSDDLAKVNGPRPTSISADTNTRTAPRTLDSPDSTSLPSISNEKRNSSSTSLRPPNLSNETPPTLSIATPPEPQKGKKGLPFLKNPMSTLLLRRKANQAAKTKLPLTLGSGPEESSFDPRIKGTRVHDFSAPRRKSRVPAANIPSTYSTSQLNLLLEKQLSKAQGTPQVTSRQISDASDSSRLPPQGTESPVLKSPSVSTVETRSTFLDRPFATGSDRSGPSVRSKNADGVSSTHGSTRTTRSRNFSLSSIPRHMRSTSSRFSFDMIGSTNQEKLLEDRHRQRELDKKAAATNGGRNSMYDDFDEDGYDYEAMMNDDGGFEERIPGVNADYDDHEEDQFYDEDHVDAEADPDNDQENFAGFVYQPSVIRSSGQEGPEDYEGNGFTQPDTVSPNFEQVLGMAEMRISESLNPTYNCHDPNTEIYVANGTRLPDELDAHNPSQPATVGRGFTDEDLYYGGGLNGYEDEFAEDLAAVPEGNGVPFDESIFDDNDTDQFGRPLPGAFALAQSRRRAAHQQSPKRPSFMASNTSTQPTFSSSTAHALVDAREPEEQQETQEGEGDQSAREEEEEEEEEEDKADASEQEAMISSRAKAPSISASSNVDLMALYQAALAAAAQKAAVAGRFERSVSPRKSDPDDPSDPLADQDFLGIDDDDDASDDRGYVDDGIAYDSELDDDAIIAEANASALANDADGWYGQEFGFYSAPISIHGAQNANMEAGDYANGGFFGPKGLGALDLSTNGWVASKEPNLTPITERSEYSNRNSFLSLGTPTMQSAGLAQLAMMGDRGDDMTLSALLRLRTKAWGDSAASLASSKEGSPRSEWGEPSCSPRATHFAGSPLGSNGMPGRKGSVFSFGSRDSDGMSLPGSPGLRLAIPILPTTLAEEVETDDCVTEAQPSNGEEEPSGSTWAAASPSAREAFPKSAPASDSQDPPATSMSQFSPNSREFSPEGTSPIVGYGLRGHRRQKGSADSISYRQEEERGERRWVMERRRTGESGQVEVVESEVVEGGRI